MQRALGLPECATPPEEVYDLAKRRGMDFVTITDHDTIAGALELADRPDVFVSEELTAWFKDEPQAVHVLCWGITPADHEWLQAHAGDVEDCAGYLRDGGLACALAHPFFAVAAPLTSRHRRRLAELFPIWETRNGMRARELNTPPAVYIETHGGTGVAGSDDHAGIDIGRTFTETPRAATPEEFLQHVCAGRAEARGDHGSAAKWAHSGIALALRALGCQGEATADPRAVLAIAERVVSQGDARSSEVLPGISSGDACALVRSWLASIELEPDGEALLTHMQSEQFSHADLFRRACREHERKLRGLVKDVTSRPTTDLDWASNVHRLFEACAAVIPYAPATAFLGKEKAKLVIRDEEPRRVALIADGIGGMHGVTRTLEEIRERGVPGFEVEVIGTDPGVDRRLATVSEVETPFYAGLELGIPSLPAIVEALSYGRYDLIHLCSPGPAGAAAALLTRIMGLPIVASYHTELAAYARLRSESAELEEVATAVLRLFYAQADLALSPSAASDRSLEALGVPTERVARWERGVDRRRFDPRRRVEGLLPGEVNVLYAGRLAQEKGMALLAEAFLLARERDQRLHLVLAGGGPEEQALRSALGEHATFLGWLDREELAQVYASADLFLFASSTDTFGQVIIEAQASGLPVIAVRSGGPAGLIQDRRTGRLCPPDPDALAGAVVELAGSRRLRGRLAASALASGPARGWDRSLRQLADAYRGAIAGHLSGAARRAA